MGEDGSAKLSITDDEIFVFPGVSVRVVVNNMKKVNILYIR